VQGLPAQPQRPRCVPGIDPWDRPVGRPLRIAPQGMARGGRRGFRHRADREKDHGTPRVRRAQPRGIRGPGRSCFARLGVESLVYGFVVIQRRTGARETFTVRRQASPGSRRAPWEWAAGLGGRRPTEGLTPLILERPASPGRRHRVSGAAPTGGQRLDAATVHAANRVAVQYECDAHPWMANLNRAVRWARHGTRSAARAGGERSGASGDCGKGVSPRRRPPWFSRAGSSKWKGSDRLGQEDNQVPIAEPGNRRARKRRDCAPCRWPPMRRPDWLRLKYWWFSFTGIEPGGLATCVNPTPGNACRTRCSMWLAEHTSAGRAPWRSSRPGSSPPQRPGTAGSR